MPRRVRLVAVAARTSRHLVALGSLVGAAILGVAASGCGPIEFVAAVPFDAHGAYGQARLLDGERLAPYEMTAAREYLHKSRELAGFARFHSAVEFGRKAGKLAREAQKVAQRRKSSGEAPILDVGTPASPAAASQPPTDQPQPPAPSSSRGDRR